MGGLPERKNTPPWVKVPDDLKEPEVFQVQTWLVEPIFGQHGLRISYFEQVSTVMLELRVLESSNLTEVLVYSSFLFKMRILESIIEWYHLLQERGMLKLEKP
ncbi:developmental pluripotency-associated 5 protein-like [Erinaceus europaeus]|uniref:Developmental pluripotency-associated 5 protein-like n=1 Tax=Erinaceus europaeus TaxID=9365 RepID=A0A1S3WV23_ERIEU|nr:developmental pluripotency-associated 5 protein-like [Erinaceus europaeus]